MRTVLVVDDDRQLLGVLRVILEMEGYRVRAAYNGLAAMEEVERERPDVVVTDIAMPGLDGVTLARRLRARGIPVALLSAAADDPALPGVPWMPKPFDLDQFLETLARMLREERAHPDGRQAAYSNGADPE